MNEYRTKEFIELFNENSNQLMKAAKLYFIASYVVIHGSGNFIVYFKCNLTPHQVTRDEELNFIEWYKMQLKFNRGAIYKRKPKS